MDKIAKTGMISRLDDGFAAFRHMTERLAEAARILAPAFAAATDAAARLADAFTSAVRPVRPDTPDHARHDHARHDHP